VRGRFVMALSGGKAPWLMVSALANEAAVPWDRVHLLQVDERVAPAGHPDRNLTHLRENLLARVPLCPEHIHSMPVESDDLSAAAQQYSQEIAKLVGSPAVLDLVHLGLGSDGHTASLVPGDPVLHVTDIDVAITEDYRGRQRMTLTYPIINRSHRILWLVTGQDKASMLVRLLAADRTIPAGAVSQQQSLVLADHAAALKLRPG
jgi:6-phosphogluconolactonase